MNKIITSLFAALFLLTGVSANAAELSEGMDISAQHSRQEHLGLSETVKLDDEITFSGFVDTSFYSNENADVSTFSLDQVELDITKQVDGLGGFRFDLQHVNGDETTGDAVMEQGYIYVDLGSDATFMFGKFNAPIGFESLDAPDMYQFSHAQVFDYGLPTNLTGAMLSGSTGIFDATAYLVNGWDLISDDNKDKTFGGRIGVTPMEGANIGFSYISGNEGAKGSTAKLTVFDIDATLEMVENLLIGFEYNSGTYEGMSAITTGDDATWTGYLVMANYTFNDKVGLTLRYDSFSDKEGARLGNGLNETRNVFTISPNYAISDGLLILAEYRYTTSDQKTFTDSDGNAKDNETEFAIEMTYSF